MMSSLNTSVSVATKAFFIIFSSVLALSLVGAESINIGVQPENPSPEDLVRVAVTDENGEAMEGVTVKSRNNLIGETGSQGSLTFTPASQEDYVLTAQEGDKWDQEHLEVSGAVVSSDSSDSVDQSMTGHFTEDSSNMYYLGFLLGVLGGVVIILQYTGRYDFSNLI